VVATVNLPLIDRGFVLHLKAHGEKNAVRGPLSRTRYHLGASSFDIWEE
jgi:hypothetical protein